MLVGKLVELLVRPGGEADADEVGEVERGRGDVLALIRHPVGQVAHLLVPPVRADEIRVVDVGIVDVLARLHLTLQAINNVAFADQVVGDLDAGDRSEGRGQHFRFIFVRRDRFGDDVDLHALEWRRSCGEPVEFGFLASAVEDGLVLDLGVEELCDLGGGVRIGRLVRGLLGSACGQSQSQRRSNRQHQRTWAHRRPHEFLPAGGSRGRRNLSGIKQTGKRGPRKQPIRLSLSTGGGSQEPARSRRGG